MKTWKYEMFGLRQNDFLDISWKCGLSHLKLTKLIIVADYIFQLTDNTRNYTTAVHLPSSKYVVRPTAEITSC